MGILDVCSLTRAYGRGKLLTVCVVIDICDRDLFGRVLAAQHVRAVCAANVD